MTTSTETMSRRPSKVAEVANILLGILLVLSPFILRFSHSAETWNNIGVGIAVVVVALLGWAKEALAGLIVPVGAWLFFSPFVLGFSAVSFMATNIVMAFVIIAVGAAGDALRTSNS